MVKLKPLRNRSGFSLVELMLAIALFGLFATALVGLLWASYGSDVQASQRDQAAWYARTGLEAVGSIRRQGWNMLSNGSHGLIHPNGYWQFGGSADALDDGFYTRVTTVADACRDAGGSLVDCDAVGATIDLHGKKVTVTVTYTAINGISSAVTLTTYLTAWQTLDWSQTDWSGGSGQSLWSDALRYESDDGNLDAGTAGAIKLAATTSGYLTSGWFVSSAFDLGAPASVNLIEWTEAIPSCSPACQVKLQVRTAPDAGGSPGTWTDWYGAAGGGTYFTAASGTVISPDLNFNQWIQYRAELHSDGSATPVLSDVSINYLP